MGQPPRPEPRAARLYFIPRAMVKPHASFVQLFRRYFERAPGWVLLTTRGRKTGLPREVLLPCERSSDQLIVISTYGWRSQWIRNLREDPKVQVTCGGWVVAGRAEIIEDEEAKRALAGAHPFFPAAPFALVHIVLRTVLRPLLVLFLRSWVAARPVVVIRPEQPEKRQD